MTQQEFIDLLTYYLRDLPPDVIEDIIQDYREHFALARQLGQSEAEISQELGSPYELAQEYLKNERIFIHEEETENAAPRTSITTSRSANLKRLMVWLVILILAPLMIGLGLGTIGLVFALLVSLLAFALSFGTVGIMLAISVPAPGLFTGQSLNLWFLNDFHPTTKLFLAIALVSLGLLLCRLAWLFIHGSYRTLYSAWTSYQWRKKRGAYHD